VLFKATTFIDTGCCLKLQFLLIQGVFKATIFDTGCCLKLQFLLIQGVV